MNTYYFYSNETNGKSHEKSGPMIFKPIFPLHTASPFLHLLSDLPEQN